MPQMSPMNWMFLFFLFNFSLFLMMTKMYMMLNKIISKEKKLNSMNNNTFLLKL